LSHLIELNRVGGSRARLGGNLLELLKLCLLFRLELCDLLNDGLKDLVGRHVIELAQGSMNTLGILEGDISFAV
jgi:hypothetical protein